jgi:hypothetical protein
MTWVITRGFGFGMKVSSHGKDIGGKEEDMSKGQIGKLSLSN